MIGPIPECSYLYDNHILKHFYLNLNSLGVYHYGNWWWQLRVSGLSRKFSIIYVPEKMYFTAVCFATLMTRAVRARVVANNPSIAKSKFQAE